MPSIDVASAIHKARHATGGPDALTPADIGAAPSSHAHPSTQISDSTATGRALMTAATAAAARTVIDTFNGTATPPSAGWADADANTLVTAGRYQLYAGTSKNVPSAGGGIVGILEVLPRMTDGSSQIYQRWTVAGSVTGGTLAEWVRFKYTSSNEWGAWQQTGGVAILPAATDFNTLTADGMYHTDSTVANALTLNRPSTNWAGYLRVSSREGYVLQEAFPLGASNTDPETYTRQKYGTTWTPWVQTLRLKDTGWRDISALIDATWTTAVGAGTLAIRRTGDRVVLRLLLGAGPSLVGSPVADRRELLSVPSGFSPIGYSYVAAVAIYRGGTPMGLSHVDNTAKEPYILDAVSTQPGTWTTNHRISGEVTWVTAQPWPATLPGTPA